MGNGNVNGASATKVITGRVRFSFVNIFHPKAMAEGQDPKYSMSVLIPKKDKATIKRIEDAVKAATEQGRSLWGGKIPVNLKTPLRDGDEEKPDDAAYAGHYFINCSSRQKPFIIDARLRHIEDSTEVYSGCYGKVSINFYPFNVNGNRGIAAGLNNVQKIREGDFLGGRARAEDEFEVEDADDEGFLD